MVKPPVSFETFIQMDIRVGTIISAEAVVGSEKLLKIVEDLVNKQAVFLVNLETKMIMGFESQGMLLVAEEEGKIVLLRPVNDVKNGSVIR